MPKVLHHFKAVLTILIGGFVVSARAGIVAALFLSLLASKSVLAVEWDSDDFIVTGAPNFPQYIGIFDHDFTFKGYLDTNFLGVGGMDFDLKGNLVAVASLSTNPEVRVYSPNGALIGGFRTNNPALQYTNNLKVAPDGSYALGSYTSGVQVYTPQGAFVRQYGSGDSRGIAYLPGNRLWSGGAGTAVHVFDTISGAQVGMFAADGQTMSYSMQYSATTNTVLDIDADRDAGGVFERDLSGALLREFHVPIAQTGCTGATRGPGADVFGTADDLSVDVVHWSPNGTVAGTLNIYPGDTAPVAILWAGIVPEPRSMAFVILGISMSRMVRRGRSRVLSRGW